MDIKTVFDVPFKSLVSKSAVIDSTTMPASMMSREQADKFIDLVVDESTLLKSIRVSRVNKPKGSINRLDLGHIVSEGAFATSNPLTSKPTESVIEYDTEKYRSAFDLTSDFLEDNIEGGAARDKLLNMFSKRISTDNEIAAIESDDSLATGDGQSRENNLLGVNNGFRKILLANVPTAQIIDAGGAAPSKDLFYKIRRTVPRRYRILKPDYRYITSSAVVDSWNHYLTDRVTAMGDNLITGSEEKNAKGIGFLEIPLMPDDLNYGSTSTMSDIWVTPPSNLIWFVQREFKIEWDRVPRRDQWEVTMHWRVDFQVENPDLVVYVKNIDPDGTPYAIP